MILSKKKKLYFGLIIIAVILFSEIFVKVFFKDKLRERAYPLFFQPDTLIGFKYIPDSTSFKITPAFKNKIKINNIGFTGKDVDIQKKDDSYRIVFVGSFVATGIDLNYGKSFVEILNEIYKKNNKNIEIVNCSIEGAERSTYQLNLIKYYVPKLMPDMVILTPEFPLKNQIRYRKRYKDYMIVYYDYSIDLNPVYNLIDNKYYKPNLFKFLYDNIYSFRYLCKYYSENDNGITRFITKIRNKSKDDISGYITKKVFYRKHPKGIEEYSIDSSLVSLYNIRKFLEGMGIDFYFFEIYN